MTVATISPQELSQLASTGQPVDLIDVRTPMEFQEVHVPFARNIPLDQLDPAQLSRERGPSLQPLYVICRTGGRGRQAGETLQSAGIPSVLNVEGGTLAWDQAGLPVVRGRTVVSLERQVRIAAGTIVLIGSILGWLVSPLWIGLSAFIGAGLVFSGITDTCGMGLLLARMPWNRTTCCQEATSCAHPTPSSPVS